MSNSIAFASTVKGGLPVIIEAEIENGNVYPTAIYWRGRKNNLAGSHVPDCIYEAVTRNDYELDRIAREAFEEVDRLQDYYLN
jgi:hypothetical protein